VLTLLGLFGGGTTSAFGQPQQNNTASAFGTTGGFGSNTGAPSAFGTPAATGGGLFGAAKPATTGFGTNSFGSGTGGFGSTSAFGQNNNTNTGGGFGCTYPQPFPPFLGLD